MRRLVWLKSKIGAILLPALFIAITGCGAGGGTGGAVSSGGTTGGTTGGGTTGGGTTGGGTTGGGTTTNSATLSWSAPMLNVDGTPLNDLAGYKIYLGTSSGAYTTTVDVGNSTTYSMTGLDVNKTYYYAVTAYDTSGNESNYSTEVVL